MTRRSPYRHPVKQHRRDGALVHHYERGEGGKPSAVKVIGSASTGSRWRVSRGGGSVTVEAADILAALRRGVDTLPPGETVTVNRA